MGTIHLTACGCSGSTKEMLVSQKGSLSAVDVRGGVDRGWRGGEQGVVSKSHRARRGQEERKGVEVKHSP